MKVWLDVVWRLRMGVWVDVVWRLRLDEGVA